MYWCNFIRLLPTSFRYIQRSVVFHHPVLHSMLIIFIEEDGSCWINWDKSQLRPQQVFDNTTRNYKDLQENCWERLMVRKLQNVSDLFDSRNPRFQNTSSLSIRLHIRYDLYNNHELLKGKSVWKPLKEKYD